MNGFRKLQERLREEGWFVEWNMPCCQSCAWGSLPWKHEEGPFKGEELDLSKVLFNHSQDCEIYDEDEEECSSCEGEGMIDNDRYEDDPKNEEQYLECDYCAGEGYLRGNFEVDYEPDVRVDGFACMPPEVAKESSFCFDGDKQGVKNLKEIIPIIEECGCTINWNGSGDCRPTISWEA